MDIRDACPDDAAAACHVVRQSIVSLCGPDHRGDPAVLSRWLANKTPDEVEAWIARPDASVLLAVDDGVVLGVAGVDDTGLVTLNYVSPAVRFRGVSRALLAAAEARARERGSRRCTLHSTATARRFYLACGYTEGDAGPGRFGTEGGCDMWKELPA